MKWGEQDSTLELDKFHTMLEEQKEEISHFRHQKTDLEKLMPTNFSWVTYLTDHLFQINFILELYGWSKERKGITILGKLDGEALTIAGEQTSEELVSRMMEHISPEQRQLVFQM